MSDKTNPNQAWAPNQYSAMNVALSGPIGIPLEQGGNTVDPARINKTMGGSGAESASKPLGAPQARPGY